MRFEARTGSEAPSAPAVSMVHFSEDPTRNSQLQRILEGLRKAGVRENSAGSRPSPSDSNPASRSRSNVGFRPDSGPS
jgi:hypothetical protein